MNTKLDAKIQKILKAIGPIKPGTVHVSIEHDDGCPALITQRLSDCTCKPDIMRLNPC